MKAKKAEDYYKSLPEDTVAPIVDNSGDERVVESNYATGIWFPTIFTMKPENKIPCARCNEKELIVVVVLCLETFTPRIFHSCGSCSGSPKYFLRCSASV